MKNRNPITAYDGVGTILRRLFEKTRLRILTTEMRLYLRRYLTRSYMIMIAPSILHVNLWENVSPFEN